MRHLEDVQTQVTLRPLANPLPLGFLALAVATMSFAALQIGWVPPTEGATVAYGVLVLTVPLQLLAAVMGFLARDPVAATGMGILSGTWGAVCLASLTSPAGATSAGLGVLLLCSAAALLVPGAAALTEAVPAAVILTSAARFALTGIAQINGDQQWLTAAGWVGVALAALAAYAALALELEGAHSRTVLPLGRRGASRTAMHGDPLGEAGGATGAGGSDRDPALAREPGVRPQL